MRRIKKYPFSILNWLENPMSEDTDYELILELIYYICNNKDDGAILVFLSGWDQISKLTKILKDKGFGNTCKIYCINVEFLKNFDIVSLYFSSVYTDSFAFHVTYCISKICF